MGAVARSDRAGGAGGAGDGPRHAVHHATDDELVRWVRAGSLESFEAIFDRYRDPILSFCRHMLGSREDAEDAAQHTFLSAHRALRDTDRAIELRPWLFAIARNRCLDMLRARRQSDPLEEERIAPASIDGLLDTVQRREDLRAMVADIQALPVAQREALVMFELGGLSQSQLADVLDVQPNQVKALIYQARASLMADREARALQCRSVREELSTARGHDLLRSHLRRHLRVCAGCRDFAGAVRGQRNALALVLPALPTAGLKATVLAGAIGTAGSATGAGLAGAGALGGAAAAAGVSSAPTGGGTSAIAASLGAGGAGAAAATAGGGAAGVTAATSAASAVAPAAAAAPALTAASAGAGAGAGGGVAAVSAVGGLASGASGLVGKGLLVKLVALAGLFGALGGGVTLLHRHPARAGAGLHGSRVHGRGGAAPPATSPSAAGPGATGTPSGSPQAGGSTQSAAADHGKGSPGGGTASGSGGAEHQPAGGSSSPDHHGGHAPPNFGGQSGSQPQGSSQPAGSSSPFHRLPNRRPGSGSPPIVSVPSLPGGSSTPAGTPKPLPRLPTPSVPSVDKLPGAGSLPLPSVSVGRSGSHGSGSGSGSSGAPPSVSVSVPGAKVTLGGTQLGP